MPCSQAARSRGARGQIQVPAWGRVLGSGRKRTALGNARGGGEKGRVERGRPIIPSVNPCLNYKRIIHVQPWPHL